MLYILTDIYKAFLSDHIYILLLISYLFSFILIPPLIVISKKLKLGDKGGGRKIHKKYIPTLGGIAIIISFILSMLIWAPNFKLSIDLRKNEFIYGGISVLILFITGVRDDIIPIRSYIKLLAQILVAFIVVVFGKLYFTNLDGFLGIGEMPILISQALSMLIIIAIVNAYNLIDGIDGLAATITIISALFFGVWFLLGNNLVMFAISFGLIGALIGFLHFNLPPAKIFMGDTGSMFLGFIIAILAIRFIDFNNSIPESFIKLKNAPVVAMTVMLIPLADVGRVFMDRMLAKKSPFAADKTHIHHLLLKLGFNHIMVVTLLAFLAYTFIFVSLAFNTNYSIPVFIVLVALFVLFSIKLKFMIRKKIRKIRKP